jgi:hypothetical protein
VDPSTQSRNRNVPILGQTATVVSFLLSATFACGVFIALAHVVNQRFIAPVYDVAANLVAFGCAVAASVLLGHAVPAILASVAVVCWLVLARRTLLDHRERRVGVDEQPSRSTVTAGPRDTLHDGEPAS